MAKRLVLKPDGWPVTLSECPPGHFLYGKNVGFKSEYGTTANGRPSPDAYCGSSGEYFWGGCDKRDDRDKLMVQPLIAEWEDEE